MLLGATIFALVIGSAISAPHNKQQRPYRYGQQSSMRHQMGSNPLFQRQNVFESVQQGFLCDWCVVAVEDGQDAIGENLNEILGILNRTSQLCAYCPVQEQCSIYFINDIPAVIEDFLDQSPEALCNEAALCDMNLTLPGMVMNNLNSNIARDRVIKNMLERARLVQQELIRNILGPNYLCETCQDFMSTTRDILRNNETQYEIVEFIAPLCDYLPTEYQAECHEFVQSIPSLMTMIAKDVLVDSTCTELGFCKEAKMEDNPGISLPDIVRIDLDRDLGLGEGRGPFQIPEIPKVEIPNLGRNPFQFPGQGRPNQNPFGLPDNWNPFGSATGRQQPEQGQGRGGGRGGGRGRPGYGQTQPGRGYGRRQRPAPNGLPQRPKPKSKPAPKPDPIPDFNLDDILAKTQGIVDQLPDKAQMPLRLPTYNINIPGFGRIRRAAAPNDKVKEILPDLFLPDLNFPEDRVHHEYVPDPIPDAGITITEQGVGDCEICKMAVTAVDEWLQDNEAQLQKMVSQFALPFCTVFPSPMKQDCVSDVSEFVDTFIQVLVSKLQPNSICTWLGQCDATAVPIAPYTPTAEVPRVEPTTWQLP
ncbi:uncharacterized protein [Amphiura filiformis]|uniref:uncharacterized protein isoform X3 n=1 Tax=Amphiura filiformis TaxID=82378 RepID=UPI003B21B0F3